MQAKDVWRYLLLEWIDRFVLLGHGSHLALVALAIPELVLLCVERPDAAVHSRLESLLKVGVDVGAVLPARVVVMREEERDALLPLLCDGVRAAHVQCRGGHLLPGLLLRIPLLDSLDHSVPPAQRCFVGDAPLHFNALLFGDQRVFSVPDFVDARSPHRVGDSPDA